jgi:glycosyltransferase involved in cell wall biosynthesis
MKKNPIVISYNTSWYVWNFRMPLIAALRGRGRDVVVLAPRDEYTDRIVATGVGYRELPLSAKGKNPLAELAAVLAFVKAYRELKPAVVLQYTIKPNLYGSLAARFLRIPAVNNVTGLGAAFEGGGPLEALARFLYRLSFSKVERVFFQNPDDFSLFLKGGLVREEQADLLPGSGVDLARFSPRPRVEGPFTFLFVGRLLKAKGVEDLVRAAAIVKAKRPEARIVLLGKRDDEDPGAADPVLLDAAASAGTVELAGTSDDVRIQLAQADCVVLPSFYREGTPRSLLEAAAMGKPLIAADSVGTREPVSVGVNGFLHRPHDSEDLAGRMIEMIELPPETIASMGRASREIAEARFDERIVIGKYLEIVERIVSRKDGKK